MAKITAKVASQVLGVTPRRVDQMADEGKLSYELISNGAYNIRVFTLDNVQLFKTMKNKKVKKLTATQNKAA